MRLSELAGKRIINIYDGDFLGTAGESDLLIDGKTGEILQILLPPARGFSLWRSVEQKQLAIHWQSVRKIGSEVIVVDIAEKEQYYR